mgnify:CR=1 FL=1
MTAKTLKEIAAETGVSASMVSLVLHDRVGVGKENRGRIAQALRANGYRIQKGPRSGETGSLCFLKFSLHGMLVNGNPGFVNAIIDAVEKESSARGYSLVMTNMDERTMPAVLAGLAEHPPSGVILLGTELDARHLPLIGAISAPFVIVDSPMEFERCACVTMNNQDAICEAVGYLARLGHPAIGFLANAVPGGNCLSRRNAFERAVRLLGRPFDPGLIYSVSPTMEGAYQSVRALLEQGTTFPSALVANNDSIALGAVKAFREAGLRVPEDIAIIGFDDIGFSAIADPPLTTMRVSCAAIGQLTVRLLCDRIADPSQPLIKLQVCPDLIVRQSTCAYAPERANP